MTEKFNIKEGLAKALKTALRDGNFITAVFDLLLGREEAAAKVEYGLKTAAQDNTINEVVAVHRLYKKTLSEGILGGIMGKPKELMQQLEDIRNKSEKFQRKVLVRTLKKPGMFAAFVYVIKALVTAGYPIDDIIATPQAIKLIAGLIETAVEVAGEEGEMQMAVNEAIMKERMERTLRHVYKNHSLIMESIPANGKLSESFDPNPESHVSLFVGRFQPFTLGHVKCLMKLKEAYNRPVLICAILVEGANVDEDHPFSYEIQKEMYERLKSGLNEQFPGLIADIIYVKNAYIGTNIEAAKQAGYQPIAWGCGSDRYLVKKIKRDGTERYEGYKPMHDGYVKKQSELSPEEQDIDVNPETGFNLLHIQRDTAGTSDDFLAKVSGTDVRNALKNDDRRTFESMMPVCLYPMYEKFRNALMAVDKEQGEPAYQTITESQAFMDFKKKLNEGLRGLMK